MLKSWKGFAEGGPVKLPSFLLFISVYFALPSNKNSRCYLGTGLGILFKLFGVRLLTRGFADLGILIFVSFAWQQACAKKPAVGSLPGNKFLCQMICPVAVFPLIPSRMLTVSSWPSPKSGVSRTGSGVGVGAWLAPGALSLDTRHFVRQVS